MHAASPIWPAQLDHLRVDSDDPEGLCAFYARALGFHTTQMEPDTYLLQGPGRRLIVGRGAPGARPYHGFRLQSGVQLEQVRAFIQAQGLNTEPSPTPLFEPDAVAVRDPDGWLSVFGVPRRGLPAHKAVNVPSALTRSGRLQHVVVASNDLRPMMRFYEDVLGFVPSDYCALDVDEPDTRRVAFYRSDEEHHSFAVFSAPEVRSDHHAYEVENWNAIRDWADHLASLEIPIWWGPGRHGPGNNLFFMIRDPHGNQIELSAEIEHMPRDMSARTWPLNERSLNLWGSAWMRE